MRASEVTDAAGVAVEFDVQVVPRASRDGIAGDVGDRLKVRLTAPPVDGEANAALIAFLAKALGVGRGQVAIVRGHTGRRKTVRVMGVTLDRVRALGEA